MKKLNTTSKFKKDLEKAKKRGKDSKKIITVIDMLLAGIELPAKYYNHKLKGHYIGTWECHIEPDWLLIYDFDDESVNLRRTGTHSDLF